MKKYAKYLLVLLLYLTIASPLSASSRFNPSDPYVPGELIVKYRSREAAERDTGSNRSPLQSMSDSLFNSSAGPDLNRRFAVYEKEPLSLLDAERSGRTIKLGKLDVPQVISAENVYIVRFNQGTVEEAVTTFGQHDDVVYAEPNYIVEASVTPNDPSYSQLWGLHKIQSDQAWDISTGSSGVSVAVVDTGIDYNHPDLAGNVSDSGYDFVNNDSDPLDDQGHGTHVAGTIGAVANNNLGVAGVNWSVSLLGVKVLNSSGNGTNAWVARGIDWASENGADVINMSLGGPYPSQTINDAVARAVSRGVVVIAAAGNENSNDPHYPAAVQGVFSVAASTQGDNRASFSNYGSWVDIAAPGTDICSTTRGGGIQCWNGTSMASPHVAGVAALVLSVNSSLSPQALTDILFNTGDNVTIPLRQDQNGNSKRLNAYRVLMAAGGSPEPTLTPSPTPSSGGPTPTTGPSPTPGPSGLRVWVEDYSTRTELPDGAAVNIGDLLYVRYLVPEACLQINIHLQFLGPDRTPIPGSANIQGPSRCGGTKGGSVSCPNGTVWPCDYGYPIQIVQPYGYHYYRLTTDVGTVETSVNVVGETTGNITLTLNKPLPATYQIGESLSATYTIPTPGTVELTKVISGTETTIYGPSYLTQTNGAFTGSVAPPAGTHTLNLYYENEPPASVDYTVVEAGTTVTPAPTSSPTPQPSVVPTNTPIPGQNNPPVINSVSCNPCSIQTWQKASVTADAYDPDGDTLNYNWYADPAGTFEGSGAHVNYFANYSIRPAGITYPINVNLTVSDGRGATANGSTVIDVTQP